MTHRIDPLVQTVKPIRPKAGIDRASRNTEADQLPARHDTVLFHRKSSQATIDIDARNSIRAFATHIVVNARLVVSEADRDWHAANSAGRLRTCDAQDVAKSALKETPARRYRLWL